MFPMSPIKERENIKKKVTVKWPNKLLESKVNKLIFKITFFWQQMKYSFLFALNEPWKTAKL